MNDSNVADDRANDDVDAIEADIERTREELAQTVDQLAAKLDVKSRARDKAVQLKEKAAWEARFLRSQATDSDGKPKPAVLAGGGAVVAGIAAVVLVALWRRSSRPRTKTRRGR